MRREAYPAARTVSPTVQAYFARHAAEARRRGNQHLAPLPDAETIEACIDAAFWASLRREEGYVPKISLAFLPPDQAVNPVLFERRLPLDPSALTKVAPAVERPGIHLGVWSYHNELWVWGTTRSIPAMCFVVEVAAPGLLVIKHQSGEESGKFVNVVVFEGDQVKVVDEHASDAPGCPSLVLSLLGFESPMAWAHSVNVLVQLAVSMRAHGHGGSLLVVPAGSESWRESIVWPMPYAVSPPFCELADLSREIPDETRRRPWQKTLGRTIEAVAGLTAVDGAVVLNNRYELLGFGAKIARRKGHPQIERVMVSEPVEGDKAAIVHPEQLGGTRHLSAAQFVQDQQDAAALVASQDGGFTIFEWSACEETVQAHRVGVLLL
jgi:hypothetical protein